MATQGVGAILLGDASHGGGDMGTNNGASRVADVARIPTVPLSQESFGRIGRILAKGLPVTLALNMQNTFYPQTTTSCNVIGEIPGTEEPGRDDRRPLRFLAFGHRRDR
jgi:hypothetical protein